MPFLMSACSLMVFVKWFLWFEAHCFHNPRSYTRFHQNIYHSNIHHNSRNCLSYFQKSKLHFKAIRILHFHSLFCHLSMIFHFPHRSIIRECINLLNNIYLDCRPSPHRKIIQEWINLLNDIYRDPRPFPIKLCAKIAEPP